MRTLIADNALSAIVVAGIEGAALKMLPIRLFDGRSIKRWNPRVWLALFGGTLFTFVTVLLNPDSGYIAHGNQAAVISAFALFIAFGTMSVVLWARSRGHPGSSHPDDLAAHLDPA